MRRSRLSVKGMSGKKDRLSSAIRSELKQVSDRQLADFASAKSPALKNDPILAVYKSSAVDEIQRRKILSKEWGMTPAKHPKLGSALNVVEKSRKELKALAKFYYDALHGKMAQDVLFGTDYMLDKLKELHERGEHADARWKGFFKAHSLMKKGMDDYVKEGYEVKQMFNHTDSPDMMRFAFNDYKLGYKSAVLLPVKLDGEMKYALLARGVK